MKFKTHLPPQKCSLISMLIAFSLWAPSSFAQETEAADRSPAQEPPIQMAIPAGANRKAAPPISRVPRTSSNQNPAATSAATPAANRAQPVPPAQSTQPVQLRRMRESERLTTVARSPRHEIAFSAGLALNGNSDIDNTVYQHKILQSPMLKMGYQFAFFSAHPFNLLVGAEVLFLHSEDVASSSKATATFRSNILDGGPTVGIAWNPEGPGTPFQLQAKFGTGLMLSRDTRLQSGGFSTSINNERTQTDLGAILPGVVIWEELIANYLVDPNWRLIGSYLHLEKTSGLMVGAAYVF